MNDNTVWTSTLDNRYTVTITRMKPYHAELTIADGEQVIHRQPVVLKYDALFGPDVDNVCEWQEIAVQFIDGCSSSQ